MGFIAGMAFSQRQGFFEASVTTYKACARDPTHVVLAGSAEFYTRVVESSCREVVEVIFRRRWVTAEGGYGKLPTFVQDP